MILEVLKFLFLLLIAVPFLYMMYDVVVDVLKRIYGFYNRTAKPALLSMFALLAKF